MSERLLSLSRKLLNGLAFVLIGMSLFLALMHHAFWQYAVDPDNIIASYFDLDSESTIGSWFAAIQWFCVAMAAAMAYLLERIYELKARLRIWWLVVAFVFLVASVDEISMIHETAGELLKMCLSGRGYGASVFAYFEDSPWLVFYTVPILSFIFLTLWFLSSRFGGREKSTFLCASGFACYVVAMILEFVQGMPPLKLSSVSQLFFMTNKTFYGAAVLVEETLENLGTSLLLLAFLWYCHQLVSNHLVYKSEPDKSS